MKAVASCVVLALFSCAAIADDDARPDAVPYRPTVSTPAALSAPGWFELEAGGLQVRDLHPDADTTRRSSLPYTLKYAFTDDWGVRVGGEAVVGETTDGRHVTGGGDSNVVLKRRFALDDKTAFGLEAGVNIPSARHGLGTGSGKPDYSLNGIFSSDFGRGWHTDVNLEGTRLGTYDGSVGRLQSLAAWSLSNSVTDRITLEGEVSGVRQHHAPGTAQVLGALAYAWRRDLVFDVGTAHALNRNTPTWQVFAGMTVVLGKL